MKWQERTYCGDLRPAQADRTVLLMGWVDAIRDHGNVLFIHLRDIRGIVQVVFDPKVSPKASEKADSLREEAVVEVTGSVTHREKGTENANLLTGEIEVIAEKLEILSSSKMLPFQISEKAMVFGEAVRANPDKVDEDLRLQYRYLDLRRPSLQRNFLQRYEIIKCIRRYLDEQHFVEIETPFLTKSTPEGARDYLVPSRVHRGRFYSLPQSPQLFKQLIMLSGMDRYFQIARCFRDEDLRPNRQPEFTQLDMEAAFIDEEFIYEVVEELTVRMFALEGITLNRPFPRLTYDQAMKRYGTDRPDVRFDMVFRDATDIFRDTGYSIFRNIIGKGGGIKGFSVKGQAGALSKNLLQNEYAMKIVPSFGAGGMTWMKVRKGALESNIVQFFSEQERKRLMDRFDAEDGDVLIMIADHSRDLINEVLCKLRLHLAKRLGLIPEDRFRPLWVTDFPLFELKEGRLSSKHHPFTMPDRTDFDLKDINGLLQIRSRAYDLVMNGEELGGGSIRIHRMDLQKKIFQALELGRDEIESKFGFFLRALEFGAPPHGGLALGIDRVMAMILKTPSIREVIAFPKNRSAFCPLTRAPSFVATPQVEELGLFQTPAALQSQPSVRPRHATGGEEVLSSGLPASKKISESDLGHLAKLARLRLSESEAVVYEKDLNDILEYFETLKDLDTRKVEPMSHVLKPGNVWREDTPGKPQETKGIMSNAPQRDKNYFRVPKILEG